MNGHLYNSINLKYENRLEICYKAYNELDDVKPFIMLETLNEVTIMKIDQ